MLQVQLEFDNITDELANKGFRNGRFYKMISVPQVGSHVVVASKDYPNRGEIFIVEEVHHRTSINPSDDPTVVVFLKDLE